MTFSCASPCGSTGTGPSLVDICGASSFVIFLSLLDELIRSNDKVSRKCDRVVSIDTPDEEYDFVVIGGGGAGAVVAGRLSENPDWKVLVLEAGPDEPVAAGIPLFSYYYLRTSVDWKYRSTNESHACLAMNGSCEIPSGKMLGGGTGLNAMIYLRGNPTDYNNWAALGNEGWTWEEVKPFFLMGEDNGEIERVGRIHHGTGGPLSIERFPYLTPFAHTVLAASEQAGYGVSDDLNGDQITGFSITQSTTKNGLRSSSASAYLWPNRNRQNLHISLNSHATKVILENKKAVGVEYYQGGKRKTVRVAREVVVSASTLRSPQILLLSGIGPKKHLESVGIKVLHDLPGVGENLHDHIGYNTKFTIDEPAAYDNDWHIAAKYLLNQTGPLSGSGLSSVIATLNTEDADPDFPNVQLHFGGYATPCAPGEIGAQLSPDKRLIVIRAINLHPKSRGRISLASNDPLADPVIWFNYLSDPSDVDILVKAIKMGLAMAETPALKAYNLTVIDEPPEACSNYTYMSTEYLTCVVRQYDIADIHHGGSCKMGPASDPMAVVDPRLRVHGIEGLRVADNSIMPVVASCNTAAPAMMIGERAADFIKKDWAS